MNQIICLRQKSSTTTLHLVKDQTSAIRYKTALHSTHICQLLINELWSVPFLLLHPDC